jgi:hypothetical protein
MKTLKIFLSIAVVIGGLFWAEPTTAQQNLTLYNMKALPQRLQVNPAKLPDSRIYVGLPLVSSFHMTLLNEGFRLEEFDQAFYEIPGSDSFGVNINQLGAIFSRDNYLSLNADVELLNFGFKVGKNYFHASSTFKNDFRLSYPGDAFDLLFQGNGGQNVGRTFNFNFGVDAMQTLDFAVGYSREVTNKLTVGGRVKRILGISTITTERNDVSFTTRESDFAYLVKSDIAINSASIYGNILADSNVNFEPPSSLSEITNGGWGLDLGAVYNITKRIEVSASIVDLGYINWESNTTRYESENPGNEFVFEGFEFEEIFGDSADIGESFQNLADSIIDAFNLDSSGQNFRQQLFTEFYLGGNFHLTKNHNAGLLFYGTFYNRKLRPGVTLSWNSRLSRIFSISASASMMAGTVRNVGLGAALNLGPLQTYFVSDNVLGAVNPLGSKVVNFRGGINLTIGRKAKKLKENKKDKKESSLTRTDMRI